MINEPRTKAGREHVNAVMDMLRQLSVFPGSLEDTATHDMVTAAIIAIEDESERPWREALVKHARSPEHYARAYRAYEARELINGQPPKFPQIDAERLAEVIEEIEEIWHDVIHLDNPWRGIKAQGFEDAVNRVCIILDARAQEQKR